MSEKQNSRTNMIGKLLRPWWRLTRAQTLGAQGVLFDENNSVLLVRHGYCPGWHFPGGGVEHGQTVLMAAAREVREETGIEVNPETAELHGFFANFQVFPGDHIALFIMRDWQRIETPTPNTEIREQRFFSPDDLPKDTGEPTKRRLNEILRNAPIAEYW